MNAVAPAYVWTAADYSSDGRYRYALWRAWRGGRGRVAFVLLNPATATESAEDPTLRRCVGFARRWGYASLVLLNLFGFRSVHPAALRAVADPVGPENARYLQNVQADVVVIGWGRQGTYQGQDRVALRAIANPYALAINRDGTPRHPLYVPYAVPLRPYRQAAPRVTQRRPARARGAA